VQGQGTVELEQDRGRQHRGRAHHHHHHGETALHQVEGETFGRDGFFIHGASMDTTLYGQESKGCIVIPRAGREKVKDLNPSTITVTES
jgi:hypothetical protein